MLSNYFYADKKRHAADLSGNQQTILEKSISRELIFMEKNNIQTHM